MSNYQVIARKWRPQTFADVVGQEHVVRTLRNAIRNGRIANAYLFVGPRGIGKTTLARIFAKALNCRNPQDGEPCGKCESCLAIISDSDLDVIEIDAASHNSVEVMRDLVEETQTFPVGGKYKVYIIDEVHMLSKQAWNALLKTIEEPPAHVKFIFATTEVQQVLPTILSRCQRFDLQPIETGLIAARLRLIAETEKVNIAPSAIDAIARAANGGMRDAQSLLDQMIAFFASDDGSGISEEQVLSLFGLTDHRELMEIVTAMLLNRPDQMVKKVGALSKRGKNLDTLFQDILQVVRAIELCAILNDPSALLNDTAERLEEYRQISKILPLDKLQIMLESLLNVGRSLRDAFNQQVYLETSLLKAMREAHSVRLNEILDRLNKLRGAGELKYLDQLQPVTPPQIIIQQVALSGSIESAACPEHTSPQVKESPGTQVTVPQDREINSEPPPAEKAAPPAEKAAPPAVSDASAPAAENPVTASEEQKTLPVSEVPAECLPDAANEEDGDGDDDSTVDVINFDEGNAAPISSADNEEYTGDPGIDDDDYDQAPPENVYQDFHLPAEPDTPEAARERLAPADENGRRKKSIANSNPEILQEVASDPLIGKLRQVFHGDVIDVHR